MLLELCLALLWLPHACLTPCQDADLAVGAICTLPARVHGPVPGGVTKILGPSPKMVAINKIFWRASLQQIGKTGFDSVKHKLIITPSNQKHLHSEHSSHISKKSTLPSRCLVLNNTMEPLSIVSTKRGLLLLQKERFIIISAILCP